MPTPTRRLADKLIKGGVDAFIAGQRASGKSWRLIARAIFDTTKGEIDVTPETVRSWSGTSPSSEETHRG